MDIAVFSDIHGNHVAFRKCIKYAIEKKIDTFVFLGDYLGEFPYPQKTMEILYALKDRYKCFFIRGNKEEYWINHRKGTDIEWKSMTSSTGALQYCYTNITDKDIDFFENMPISMEVKFDGEIPIMICHGSPVSNRDKLIPNDEKANKIIEECNNRYIFVGHTHVQRDFIHQGKVIINPGSVGVPLHSEGKSQFMILHSGNHSWDAEYVSLDYDKEIVKTEIKEENLDELAPFWSQITIHLIETGETSHGTVLAKAMKYCVEETGGCTWYDIPESCWEKAVVELL